MALLTGGTAATTTLQGLKVAYAGISGTDLSALSLLLLDDALTPQRVIPGALSMGTGQLFVPNRGVLQMNPGDFVFIDGTGWPILLSAKAAASASWVHT